MLTVDFNSLDLRPGMRVLDAGCGGGRHLCEAFRNAGVTVVGVDLNRRDLSQARAYLNLMSNDSSAHWLLSEADVTNLPFREETFDVVICAEVLEHISPSRIAVRELLRVLRPGGDLVVTVPRFLPERICWLLSKAYHQEPGGHIRIFRKRELLILLQAAGARCRLVRYRHGLHSPYWWLRCLVGHKKEDYPLVRIYRNFLEWEILSHPRWIETIDRLLNPLIGKSLVLYLKKGIC